MIRSNHASSLVIRFHHPEEVIRYGSKREYVVLLRDGTRLTLSRGYRDKLQKILGKAL